ncbi:hypothetical protein ACVMDN_002922 [Bradyrhizobium sp. USDA 4510]
MNLASVLKNQAMPSGSSPAFRAGRWPRAGRMIQSSWPSAWIAKYSVLPILRMEFTIG